MKLRDWIELLRIQLHREEGQTMAEYGVVLAVITVGVVLAIYHARARDLRKARGRHRRPQRA